MMMMMTTMTLKYTINQPRGHMTMQYPVALDIVRNLPGITIFKNIYRLFVLLPAVTTTACKIYRSSLDISRGQGEFEKYCTAL